MDLLLLWGINMRKDEIAELATVDPYELQFLPESKSPMMDYINRAIADGDAERAAILIRRRRNALLAQTDAEMSLDRLQLTVPKGVLFSDWLKFFKQIAELLTGDMAKYRQALRDIPQQEGFPFNVKFPEKPEG